MRADSASRLLGALLASASFALGCAQIFGIKEDVPLASCTANSDCAPNEQCASGVCRSTSTGSGGTSSSGSGGGSNSNGGSGSDGKCAGGVVVGSSLVCSDLPDGTRISFPSGKPQGACTLGKKTCQPDDTFGACEGAIAPTDPDCTTAEDHNCDGTPDNTQCGVCVVGDVQDCYDGPAGTEGVGSCKHGSQTCKLDASGKQTVWGVCTSEVTPAAEDTCDSGNDNTCNGTPNESCTCLNGDTGSCGTKIGALGACAAGTTTCANGVWGACSIAPAASDTCDSGNDANCNGHTNDGCGCVNGTTQSCGSTLTGCTVGSETCQGGGYVNCSGGCSDFSVAQINQSCTLTGVKGEPTETVCQLTVCAAGYHVTDCDMTPSGGAICSFNGALPGNRAVAKISTEKPSASSSSSCKLTSCSCHADGF